MSAILQIPVDNPLVYAFRIRGEVCAEDMQAMAATMNAAFEDNQNVSMLMIFEAFDGVEAGAGLDFETMKSQFRSLANVDKYAVVGAPSMAVTMIDVMDKIITVDARTFDASDEQAAWQFVGAQPKRGSAV